MIIDRIRFKQDLDLGRYNGTYVDTAVYISDNNHPSVVSNITITGTPTTYTGPQLFAGGTSGGNATKSGGNAWVNLPSAGGPAAPNQVGVMYTGQAGDYLDIPVTGIVQVDIQLAGQIVAGMGYHSGDTGFVAGVVRNGGTVQILVDGVAVSGGVADLYNGTPSITVYLSGLSSSLRILFVGTYGSSVQPIGVVTKGTGTSVANAWSVAPSATQKSFVPATWTITCTTPGGAGVGQYTLTKTVPGGSPVTIASAVVVGATLKDSAGLIPGVAYTVNGTLVNGDTATLVTDSVMAAIYTVKLSAGSGGVGGTYLTPVLDSGRPETRWLYADWAQFTTTDDPITTITATVGNDVLFADPAPPPDGQHAFVSQGLVGGINNGTSVALAPTQYNVSSGTEGCIGLMSLPTGRYLQLLITLPSLAATAVTWLRDFRVYSWLPNITDEPETLGNMRLPFNVSLGDNWQSIIGVMVEAATDFALLVQDAQDGLSIPTATDSWLKAFGADRGLVPYTGEPFAAFRNRVLTFLQSRAQQGGSSLFILQQVVQLVRGTSTRLQVATPGQAATPGLTITVVGGLATFGFAGFSLVQTAPWSYTFNIPQPPYLGLPNLPVGAGSLARAFITDYITNVLNPVGNKVTINFS